MAENKLAFLYQHGIIFERDEAKAKSLYKASAEANCPAGLNNLAVLYYTKPREDHPLTETADLLRRAVSLGCMDAADNLGWLYEKGEYETALKILTPLAEKGNPGAQCSLGLIYEMGQGVKPDTEKAIKWYKKASGATKGTNARLFVKLPGQAREINGVEALEELKALAVGGDREAQSDLVWLYLKGHGVKQDFNQVTTWFNKAIEQKNEQHWICNSIPMKQ